MFSLLFADDTTLMAEDTNIDSLFSKVNLELEVVSDWFLSNRLCLHPKKCKFILFYGSSENSIPDIKIGDSKIDRICKNGNDESFKYVGIHLDERLSFKQHIEYLISIRNRDFFLLTRWLNNGIALQLNKNAFLSKKLSKQA